MFDSVCKVILKFRCQRFGLDICKVSWEMHIRQILELVLILEHLCVELGSLIPEISENILSLNVFLESNRLKNK